MIILSSPNRNRGTLVTYGNGLIYNWYAVNGDSGSGKKVFAPVGWHVPTQTEFNTLATYLGGVSVAGEKMKSTRTSPPYFVGGGTNTSGFNGFGSGRRIPTGDFNSLYTYGIFWTSTIRDVNTKYMSYLSRFSNTLYIQYELNAVGQSVRLIKDDSTWYEGMKITDIDGNIYPTVQIGTQVWLKSNWKCTKYNDGTAIPNVTNGTTWAGLTTGAYCSYNNAAIVEYTELF